MECDNDNCIVFEQNVLLYKNFPYLNEMRREGKFSDVTIKAKGLSLKAHKIVLSATIPYFHSMFTSNMLESEVSEVILHEIEAEILESLINFSYTGKIIIDIKTVYSLIFGASYLQLTEVLNACEDFLCSRLEICTVIGTWKFAVTLNCKALAHTCQQFIQMHFYEVSSCDEFLELTAEELEPLLSSDQLNVFKEELVFEALMRWTEKDTENRKKDLLHFLPKIRFPLISLEYLVNVIAKKELIRSSHECRDLIDEAKDYHLIPRSCGIQIFNSVPRCCESLSVFIFAVGGTNNNLEVLNTVELFNPIQGGWSLTTPMVKASARLAVAVVENYLYVIGGEYNSQPLRGVQGFDFKRKNWCEVPPMQSKRSAGGAAALGNTVYVCGGFDGTRSLKSVECYDLGTQEWTLAQPMITSRSSCAVVALDGYLYALGGHDDKTVLDLVERYNPFTETWTQVTPMLTKRCKLGAASLNGKLYVCGGYDGSSFLKTVEVYDPAENKWQMVTPMNKKRSRVALTVNMGNLWAIGGYAGDSALSTVEVYNPFLDTWTFGPPMSENKGDVGVGVMSCSKY